jgi:hypothetical protein
MDHVTVLPGAAPAEHTGSPREPTAARVAVPPVGTQGEDVAVALMRRCPGALVWFGARTRRWWAFAMLGETWTLLETQTVEELSQILTASDSHGSAMGTWGIA